MQLPETERVIYQRNPLVEVVGQLQFPQILKIVNQDPVEFQDAIRVDYPILEVATDVLWVEGDGEQLPDTRKLNTVYHFRSEDLRWQVSLSGHFIALTTKDYKRYEVFKHRFQKIVAAFEAIYKPSFYSRIGLRYQDLVIRSSLGLKDEDWTSLIPVHIAPELHSPETAGAVIASTKTLMMKIETGLVAFRHGLVEARDPEQNLIEPAYLLDSDFFSEERTAVGSYVWERFDRYNKSARNLFRWSITEKLHLAMGPQSVTSGTASN
ncbi:TIGR04255 family protein [Leptolyngbyaceae cyanobacterium UHCC 1019]